MGKHFDKLVGNHFDTLVQLVNKEWIGKDEGAKSLLSVHDYLSSIVKEAAIFEFPLKSEELFPKSGKSHTEYCSYLMDYFDLSQKNGKFMITPFPLTAIEDSVSVVFLDNIVHNKYRATICYNKGLSNENDGIDRVVNIGDIIIDGANENGSFPMIVTPLYLARWKNDKRLKTPLSEDFKVYNAAKDITNSTVAYIEQLIYIMDPENFIIRKEKGERLRVNYSQGSTKKNKKLQKKNLRPHYIFLSEEDTVSFLKSKSGKPRIIPPVRGHWRKLMSERYVHKQGQTIYIKQHYSGSGRIEGNDGWHYNVMIKESPTSVVPYSEKT